MATAEQAGQRQGVCVLGAGPALCSLLAAVMHWAACHSCGQLCWSSHLQCGVSGDSRGSGICSLHTYRWGQFPPHGDHGRRHW